MGWDRAGFEMWEAYRWDVETTMHMPAGLMTGVPGGEKYFEEDFKRQLLAIRAQQQ